MPLDTTAPRPLYLQLRDALLHGIEQGHFGPHQRLPSERELSREYKVSRITVRQALAELIQEGRVYARVGKGTYVTDPSTRQPLSSLFGFSESVRRHGRVPTSEVLATSLEAASDEIAARLQLDPGAEVVRIRRLRKADGLALVVETSLLPHAPFPGLLQRIADDVSLYSVLEESYGVRMTSAEVTLEAALADEAEARVLGLPHPTAVLRVEQTTFTGDGRPMELSRSSYRGDGYRFHAILHRSENPLRETGPRGLHPARPLG
jgi:GntR family transcriptional regulator